MSLILGWKFGISEYFPNILTMYESKLTKTVFNENVMHNYLFYISINPMCSINMIIYLCIVKCSLKSGGQRFFFYEFNFQFLNLRLWILHSKFTYNNHIFRSKVNIETSGNERRHSQIETWQTNAHCELTTQLVTTYDK